MHLARRAYVLVLLTAVLAIAAIWSGERGVGLLWRIPAALLLAGLAAEAAYLRRAPITARLLTVPRAFLGVLHNCVFEFSNSAARPLALEFAPATPAASRYRRAARRRRS